MQRNRTGLATSGAPVLFFTCSARSPVAKLVMQLCVAGLTERHQIVIPMRPALREGDNMMDFLHRSQPSFLQTHLTQRVRRSIAVADSFPSPAVLLVAVCRAAVFVVPFPGNSLMLLTVLPVREVWTAGVGAGAFWSLWHAAPRFPGKRRRMREKGNTYSVIPKTSER